MNIKAEKITIELSGEEARKLAYHIKHSLEKSIMEHYIQPFHDSYKLGFEGHAKPLFEKQCLVDVEIMKNLLGCASGGNKAEWAEKELWVFFKNAYDKRNKL